MKISAQPCLILLLSSIPSWCQTPAFALKDLLPDPEVTAPISAKDIQSKVANIYAHCRTYRDSGWVETRFHEGGSLPRVVQRPFTTAFSRPDHFRFEYQENDPPIGRQRYIISREGPVVRSWWSLNSEEEHPDSLETALAGATGVSGSSAYTIPMMLIADELKDSWSKLGLSKTVRVADAPLNGIPCYRLQRTRKTEAHDATAGGETNHMPATSSREVFWVDQKTSLILRIDEVTDFGDFWTSETTTYTPRLDQAIPDSGFVFKP